MVAGEVGKLSESSNEANNRIEQLVLDISNVVSNMHDEEKFNMLIM